MKLFKIIGVILIAFTLFACPEPLSGEPDLTIYINNKSNIPIYFDFKGKNSIMYSFPPRKDFLINPYKSYKLKEAFKVSLSDGSQIYFWIFKQSTIDKYSWKEIQEKNLYDKKYAFTLKELEAINYTIVYDGK